MPNLCTGVLLVIHLIHAILYIHTYIYTCMYYTYICTTGDPGQTGPKV